MQKIIIILSSLIFFQSCIVTNRYEGKKNYQKPYDINKIKIYLQHEDKAQLEKSYNQPISVSSYCHDSGDLYMGQYQSTWRFVEEKAVKFGLKNNTPMFFVCSADKADYIYEYSFSYESGGSAMANFFFGMSLGVLPAITTNSYKTSLVIKDKNGKKIKDLDSYYSDDVIYTSWLLIPFQIYKTNNLLKDRSMKEIVRNKENTISEMVLDSILDSIPNLEN